MPALRLFTGDAQIQAAPVIGDGPTVQQIVDWFIARKTSTNRAALIEVRRILRMFAARHGPKTVDAMIGDDLVAFVESNPRAKTGNTIGRWYRTVKQPFNQAESLGKIRVSPFKLVRIPRGDRGRDLSPKEFAALLRRANPYFRRVLIFLRYSGARPGELRELTWEMITWTETGAKIVKKKHKTSATQTIPKPRVIHLPAQLVKLLLWIKRRSIGNFVFTNTRRGPWQIASLCTNLRKLRNKAGFGPDVKLYGCRHAFGTNAILNGLDLATLAELMGHARTSTTEIYIHLAGKDDHLDAAVEKAIGKRP